MISLKSIELKNSTIINGVEVVDLLEPTLIISNNSPNFTVQQIVVVDEFTAMRPDLVSLAVYGDDKWTDLILKTNEISNPFSIEEGDYLVILELETAQGFYKSPPVVESPKTEDTKNKFIDFLIFFFCDPGITCSVF